MDDATVQERIDLETQLVSNLDGNFLPKPNTELQKQIDTIKNISDEREMSRNSDKTCLFILNFTDLYNFTPLFQIPGCNTLIDRVFETKLLGYWLTTDMKTHRHVEYLLSICYKRLWALPRLKKTGISDEDLLLFYHMKIRSVLETNSPVFHPMLTQGDREDLERIQKIVFKIILDDRYIDYNHACTTLNTQTLEQRRTKLSLNFALKCLQSDKFYNFFKLNPAAHHEKFAVPFASTSRYQNSPKVYLTRLLNEHFRTKDKNKDKNFR